VNFELNIGLTKQEDTFQNMIVIDDDLQRKEEHIQSKPTQ